MSPYGQQRGDNDYQGIEESQVLQEVVARRMTGQDEAQMLGLSVRQVHR
jgi:hypothetical protein